MNSLRIGVRIMLGFGAVVALTVVLSWYSLDRQARVRAFTAEMNDRDFYVLEQLRKIARTQDEMRATRYLAMEQFLLRKAGFQGEDPARAQAEWRRAKEQNGKLLGQVQDEVARFQKQSLSTQRTMQWHKLGQAVGEAHGALQLLMPEIEQQFQLTNRGGLREVVAHMPLVVRYRIEFREKLEAAEQSAQELIAIGRADINEYYEEARTSTLLALGLALVLAIGASIAIQRSITQPLATFMQFVAGVGNGDLRQQAPDKRGDELGDLARSLNQMVAGLREVAGGTRTAAENLGAATAEILASTQQQGASTNEQAAAVQQTNATISEIRESGAQISERARQVATAAEATSASSAAGLQAVQNTNNTMEVIREQAEAVAENVVALSEKTQAIGEITATVNDIAEQSHLLALNAAIEAAAAGEHGRSFSVVASEMKNLADQSKEATVQVRSILGEIQKGINSSVMLTEEAVKRVESGRQQAEVADRTIRQLTDNIQQSVQAFQQIVAGSSQQQIGFEQVMQAVKNISAATEQTAASTRQSERAAANLNALAQQLRSAVEVYRI
jgi:methyl-accepting chemotaxis protein